MRPTVRFLAWVVALSAPLWLAASAVDATRIIPVALPLSALQFLAVPAAAIIVTRHSGGSVRALLQRALDAGRIRGAGWRLAVVALMPLVVLLAYGLALLSGAAGAAPATPLVILPALLLVYGASALCEQLGWTALLTDALLTRYSALAAGLIAGVIWAAWHLIPFIQTRHSATWVLWQCLFTVIFRVLLTRVYLATNRSVGATIALHATYDVAFTLLPSFGSSYDPMWTAAATLLATVAVSVSAGRPARALARA